MNLEATYCTSVFHDQVNITPHEERGQDVKAELHNEQNGTDVPLLVAAVDFVDVVAPLVGSNFRSAADGQDKSNGGEQRHEAQCLVNEVPVAEDFQLPAILHEYVVK